MERAETLLIVIPMAGLSRRFREAGYDRPKYMLQAGGMSLFDHSVGSFESVFDSAQFLFIYRDVEGTDAFVRESVEALGIKNAKFAVLDIETRGQAETVALGLKQAGIQPDQPLTVFNIDTIRPDFQFGPAYLQSEGCLEVFQGAGDGWSFVESDPQNPGKVVRTTEKLRISDLCSTGLYSFGSVATFFAAYEKELLEDEHQAGELYIAPLYNHLIADGADIRFDLISADQVIFSGVPAEYEAFRKKLG